VVGAQSWRCWYSCRKFICRVPPKIIRTDPITIGVRYGTRGSVNVRMRQIADIAARQSGHRVIVENRPGASGRVV
jgi:tripartite-type tricarboxylate transporter receptor subunit TctC